MWFSERWNTCGYISVEYLGDNSIIWVAATEERFIYRYIHPNDFDKRFKCGNSSIVISPLQLVDSYVDHRLDSSVQIS